MKESILQESIESIQYSLHSQGFVVVRNAFKLTDYTLHAIYETRFRPIFNGVDLDGNVTYDGKRSQGVGEWIRDFKKSLAKLLKQLDLLDARFIADAYALQSTAGCPMQPKHTDSAPERSLMHVPSEDVPLAVIYAIESNTRLKIWPFDMKESVGVLLNPRDMVVFRGDLSHAGFEYKNMNTRIHAYIDSKAPDCKRQKGRTYLSKSMPQSTPASPPSASPQSTPPKLTPKKSKSTSHSQTYFFNRCSNSQCKFGADHIGECSHRIVSGKRCR